MPQEYHKCEAKRTEELLRVGDPQEYEKEYIRKDGSRVSVLLTVFVAKGSDGKMLSIAAIIKDLTERKKMEEQLQHSQLLSSLGEMTPGIVHEVNNPLSSILIYSEILMGSDVSRQTKKDLRIIHNEAKRATGVVRQLLMYSRRAEPKKRCLDLHGILKKALDMRLYREKVQNIIVYTNLLTGPVYVRGDSSQLTQVFINLMLNAEEALKGRSDGKIVVTTKIEGERVEVSIADSGTGIPEEDLKQVFYPFFTTKSAEEGTGLGLSTCYGIVTSHNGMIHAENNEMGGAIFTVQLPLA